MLTEFTLDALFAAPLVLVAWIIVPPLVLCISLMVLERSHWAIRIFASLIYAATALQFCFFAPLQWSWRDGLGPDSVESHGPLAVSHFMEGFVPLIYGTLVMVAFGVFVSALPWLWRKAVLLRRKLAEMRR